MMTMNRSPARLRRDGVTWLINAQFVIFGYFLYAFDPSVTLQRDDEHIRDAVAGLHGTCYAIGVVIVGATGSRILSRVGRGRGFWAFEIVLAAGIALYASVPVLPITLLGALVAGAGGSGVLLTASAALVDHHGAGSAAAVTEANAFSAGMGLLAPLVVGACVHFGIGWRPALLVTIPAMLVLYLTRGLFGADLDSTSAAPSTENEPALARLPHRYWITWAIVVAAVAIEFCMTLWCAQLLRDQAGMSRAGAATGVTAIVAGLFVGRAFSTRITARFRAETLLGWAFAVNLAGFALFWASHRSVLAFAGLAICGLGMALQYPLGVALAIRSAGQLSNLAAARLSLGTGVAIGLAPFVLGYLADMVGIRYAFLLVLLLIALAGVGLLLARRADHAAAPASAGLLGEVDQ